MSFDIAKCMIKGVPAVKNTQYGDCECEKCYGKCPQCGEQYQINGEPHFCPPKKQLPKWLKDAITDRVGAMSVFSEEYSGGYDDALEWVLSLEEMP